MANPLLVDDDAPAGQRRPRGAATGDRFRGSIREGGIVWFIPLFSIPFFFGALQQGEWLVAAFFGVVGFGLAALYLPGWLQTIELFEEHFVWRKWGRERRVRYDQVQSVEVEVDDEGKGPHQCTITISLPDDDSISLTEMCRQFELARQLNDLVSSTRPEPEPVSQSVSAARQRDASGSAPGKRARRRTWWERGPLDRLFSPRMLGPLGIGLLLGGVPMLIIGLLEGEPVVPDFEQLSRHTGKVVVVGPNIESFPQFRGPPTVIDRGWRVSLEEGEPYALGEVPRFGKFQEVGMAQAEALLPRGTTVTIYADGQEAWQVESEAGVILSHAERKAESHGSFVGKLWSIAIAVVVGFGLCVAAALRWLNEPDAGAG